MRRHLLASTTNRGDLANIIGAPWAKIGYTISSRQGHLRCTGFSQRVTEVGIKEEPQAFAAVDDYRALLP
jgi:hypothetical protein